MQCKIIGRSIFCTKLRIPASCMVLRDVIILFFKKKKPIKICLLPLKLEYAFCLAPALHGLKPQY